MRSRDVFLVALDALFRRRGRTLLTMTGVVIGTFALTVIVALGRGFQDAVAGQFTKGNQLRQIAVNPGFGTPGTEKAAEDVNVPGEMDDLKRKRLRKTMLSRRGMGNPQQKRTVHLTADRVDAIRKLPGVESVAPMIQDRWRVSLLGPPLKPATASAVPSESDPAPAGPPPAVGAAAGPAATAESISFGAGHDNHRFANRMIAGKWFDAPTQRGVVVHEFLLWKWGLKTDAECATVVGRTLVLEYRHAEGGGLGALGDWIDLPAEQKKKLEGLVDRLRGDPLKLLAAAEALELTPEERAALAKLASRFLGDKVPGRPGADKPGGAKPGPGASETGGPGLLRIELPIVGVLREFLEDDEFNIFETGMSLHADLFLPLPLAEELFARVPVNRDSGYPSLIVTAGGEDSARDITKAIRGMGLIAISMGSLIERVQTALTIITALVAFLAVIALVVAALGIINTMVMSVLERTKEIGIMKAVGARDGQVQAIFFAESVLIGLMGGAAGVGLGWLASLPGNALGRALIEKNTQMPYPGSLFSYPWWLPTGAIGFAVVVSLIAAVYPARRAAKVNPITALRHE